MGRVRIAACMAPCSTRLLERHIMLLPPQNMYKRTIPKKEHEEKLISSGLYVYSEFHLPVGGGTTIYLQIYQPQHSNGGFVVFCHGLGDYSARHSDKAESFLNNGYTVALFDQPGHGQSSGLHGLVESPRKLVASTKAVIDKIDNLFDLKNGGGKLFLVGESMGGMSAVLYSIVERDVRVAGLVLVAAFLKGHDDSRPNILLMNLARTINYVFPSLAASPAQRGNVHYSQEVEQEFVDDPFTYTGWLRVGTGVTLLDSLDIIQENAHRIRTPTLIVHGEKDRVADIEGNRWLASRLAGRVDTHWFPDGEHHLFHDFHDEIMQRTESFFRTCINEG